MDRLTEYQQVVTEARAALRRGDTSLAYRWAQQAAQLAPEQEDAWLLLAALVEPDASMEYIQKALQANPTSSRAQRGLEWARQRLALSAQAEPTPAPLPAIPLSAGIKDQQAIRASQPRIDPRTQREGGGVRRRKKRTSLLPLFLAAFGCIIFGFAAWSAVTSPVMASLLGAGAPARPSQPGFQSFAKVDIPKPTVAPQVLPIDIVSTPTSIEIPALSSGVEALPDAALTGVIPPADINNPTLPVEPMIEAPTETPTVEPVPTGPTETPGVMVAEIIPDTPTAEYVPPPEVAAQPARPAQTSSSGGGHWIDVDLSQQRLYAYEGDTIVNSFLVSTGTWQTPTVTGKFKVWIKLRYSDMTGPGYYLPDVPYVMYFYKDYGLHGTYWHNNFGTPMSHGCVNLSIPDAAWLYNFSAVGTTVNVHY